MNTTLALLFHEYGFFLSERSSLIFHGPYSKNTANSDEHPGPPDNQNTNGS